MNHDRGVPAVGENPAFAAVMRPLRPQCISGYDPLTLISSFCAMGHTRAHNRAAGAGAARVIRAEARTSRNLDRRTSRRRGLAGGGRTGLP